MRRGAGSSGGGRRGAGSSGTGRGGDPSGTARGGGPSDTGRRGAGASSTGRRGRADPSGTGRRGGPRLARRLLQRVLDEPGAEAIIGDIEEGYAGGRSRLWYWSQAIGALASWARRGVRGAGLGQDLKIAARKLRLRPGFTAVVVLTLALGIGANAAVFSVIDQVLLTPLPYPEPERLVAIEAELTEQGGNRAPSSPPELAELTRGVPSLAAVGGVWYRPAALTDAADAPEDIDMAFVSAGLLPALGVDPQLGRHPLPQEDVTGAEPVIVLSDHLWRRRYGADPGVVGRRIEMDDEPHTVVGVMPAGFRVHLPPAVAAPGAVDAWVTFGGSYEEYRRTFRIFEVVARRAPGATLAEVDAELAALAATTRGAHADYAGTGYELRAAPLDALVVAEARPGLLLLWGAVGAVLLIVCANVANLHLVRAAEARREIALRRALGATPGRLWRAITIECALVTAAGAAAGILVARAAVAVLPALAPAGVPRLDTVALDGRVAGFAVALAAATALLFAVLSAQGVRGAATSMGAGPRAAGSVGATRLRNGLLVAEIALSLVLLIGVGLMVRSFANLARVDPGFDPEGVTTIEMSLIDTHFYYREQEKIAAFYRQVTEQVAELPGVEAAGVTTHLPSLSQAMRPYAYESDGEPIPWGARSADYRTITPGWMEAIGARLLAGRLFEPRDDADHAAVVIVDDMLAAAAWPGEDPVGRRLQVEIYDRGQPRPVWAEVIGVVQHLRHDPTRRGTEQVFLPHAQSPMRTTVLTIRGRRDPASLGASVAAVVRGLDGDQPIGVAVPMTEHVDATLATRRFALALLSAFSGVALLLALVGTYGVVSYAVSRRTREIGIRMAIGAAPSEVLRGIVVAGGRLALAGIVLGVAGALAMTRLLTRYLVDVAPHDVPTFAALALTMLLVTIVACYLPARRAARLDPTEALRER